MTQQRQRGSNILRVETSRGPRWRFRVDLEPSSDGKRRQATRTFKSEKDAVEAQSSIRAAVAARIYTEPSRVTLNTWLDDWLAIGSRTWRASTTAGYLSNMKPARAAFGSKRLQQLTRADVESLVRQMLTEGGRGGHGRSPRTVALLLTVLGKALGDAVDEGLVATNVAARVKKPAQQHREMQTWTAGQMSEFLASVDDDSIVAAWHLSSLGLRRGEVLGLRWGDVDLDAGVVHVRQARVQAGREVVTNAPKTSRGRRTLPMHPALIAALRATRERTVAAAVVVPLRQRDTAQGDRLIVVDDRGEPMTPDRFSDLFEAHVRAA